MNPAVATALGLDPDYADRHLAHYTRALAQGGKYDLTIWPYHALLGGIGHALVSAVEEAIFFHGVARLASPDFQVKGEHRLTEHYSMLGPEVTRATGRRAAGGQEPHSDRAAARVRCSGRSRSGQEPLPGLDHR